MANGGARPGEEVVKSVFGATLADQGRGFYVALELLALARGTLDASGLVLPPYAAGESIRIVRRSHDFIRRLMAEPCALAPEELGTIDGRTFETLKALAEALRVPIPGRRKRPDWLGEHLYPFVGELVHYDAVFRRTTQDPYRVSIERYTYRGAGGLAHRILREDPDDARLTRTREGLIEVVGDSGTPLGRLFAALREHDRQAPQSFEEGLERDVEIKSTPWIEQLRAGFLNVLSRSIPTAKKVEALMHWVPYCIARHQAHLAFDYLGQTAPPFVVDLGISTGPLRNRARIAVDAMSTTVVHALEREADRSAPELLQARSRTKWRDTCRAFLTGTLGVVGALNAMTGRRHLTMRSALLEATVLAQLPEGEELPFDRFCRERLFGNLAIVVDKHSASRSPELSTMDRTDFDENAGRLAAELRGLGMLREYSDMTQMVRGEVE